ncbi:type IV secretion protein Rhs [Amycolatopsis balhimycina DSM 5908]|uniref:Type IV secretion protein Rhs n=1 Tax=Amycolatopsis balhimycina DSM 5908 TaxID=1081091 RepID=A0A428WS05_AMYBA|nr:type IV secretion protein Rhs [Amycolatopsis balhimycina DSM 5908]
MTKGRVVRRRSRRGLTFVVATQLAASLLLAVAAPSAWAGEPSVKLDGTPSVPVSGPSWRTIEPDQASAHALTGNQQAKPAQEGAGTATASPLSPSASWAVSPHTGDFTWSYPLRVPPAAGPAPGLSLSYRSSAVDGRTMVTNNQPSWVGDGWDLSSGFVERAYWGCSTDSEGDVKPAQVGDLCWRSDNATASYGGAGGQLIRDDATGKWRSRGDDGSRIEHLTGAANGDNDGEYWKITTVDGTQYFFGSEADSTWTVPVFGDDSGEPCHGASFDASSCTQPWRWNLDKVVDRNGNEMRYYYTKETNSYGFDGKDAAVPYARGGYLDHIDYGLGHGAAQPSGRVVFTTADRCVPGSDCRPEAAANWPDVPWEAKCDTAACAGNHSPTFWTTKRLASVTTKVWRGTDFGDVDRWDLDQQYPDPGDGEKAALWLKGIKHTGLAGAPVDMPSVTFQGTPMYNRVELPEDGASPLMRYRITGIVSETGGVTSITYESECKAGNLPANPESNTKRCFPVRWAKKNMAERTDYFHKYVVTAVVQTDRLTVDGQPASTFPEQVTRYEYLDGAAWHWDTSEFTKDDKRTWNEFRGFGRVRVRSGTADDPAGPVTMSEQRFYRGMDGDHLPSGTRSATVTDSEGGVRADADWLEGFGLETATFAREGASDQPDPPRLSKTITEPAVQGPVATRGAFKAYLVRPGVSRGYTAVGTGWRTTRTETTYDDLGLATAVNDLGDTGTDADDRCAHTEYARNDGAWLMSLPGHVWTDSVRCGASAEYPRDALSDAKTTYDAHGNATKTEVAKDRPAAGPVYLTTGTATYDAQGRVTAATDVLGRTTTTAYTPADGGPVTQTVVTSPGTDAVPAGLVTTTALDPAWGVPTLVTDPNLRKTEMSYDALGRAVAVWTPTWTRTDHPDVPNVRTAYLMRGDKPTVVTTTRIGPTGAEISGNTIYDGLLRPRQAQAPAIGGGRLLTDTRYDSQGRAWKTTQPYYNDKAVDDGLWIASDVDIPGHTRTHFDGAGRADASIYFAGAFEKRRTSTAYFGDHVDVTPPAGGTPTSTYTDARGQTVELRQLHNGGFDATRYTYTKAGQAETMTDPSGAVWRFGYDFLGRQVSSDDPDSGLSTKTYDDAGQVLTARDARGSVLAYTYDSLGRPTGKFAGSAAGKKLAEWTYDTVTKGKGKPASSTSWVDDKPYAGKVLSYDPAYRPTGTSVIIPPAEGLLAGTYSSYTGYNPDGSVSSQSYAAAGELPAETVSFAYDELGPLASSSGGYDGSTTELVSATNLTRYGEPARLTLGTGTKRVWLSQYYDQNDRRLTRSIVDTETPSPMQSDVHYSYDPAGSVTSLADTFAGDVQCFRSDGLQRLTEAWTAPSCSDSPSVAGLRGPAPYWQSFTYDKAGNRATDTRHAASGDVVRTSAGQVPGHAHALGSVSSPGGSVSYQYTAAGQLASRSSGEQFTWDEQGKLASVTKGSQATSYVYDASGGRLIRRDPAGTTLYLGGQELRVAAAGGNPTVTRYYGHGGRTIAMRQGRGTLTWLASDHQSTARTAIDSGTLAVTHRRQLPFGGPRDAASFPGERGFAGGVKDASTGLTHLGAREYDPDTGRFISVDPLLSPGDPQQLNGYTYSNNNPITMSDPSGLKLRGSLDDGCPLETGCQGSGGNSGTNNGTKNAGVMEPIGKRPGLPPASDRPPRTVVINVVKLPDDGKCREVGSSGYGSQPCQGSDNCPTGYMRQSGYLQNNGAPSPCVSVPTSMTSEEGHMLLDICGTLPIPYLSQGCDVVNVIWYGAEGDTENALISAMGLAPGPGDVGTGARLIKDAIKIHSACHGGCGVKSGPHSHVKEGDVVHGDIDGDVVINGGVIDGTVRGDLYVGEGGAIVRGGVDGSVYFISEGDKLAILQTRDVGGSVNVNDSGRHIFQGRVIGGGVNINKPWGG